MSDVVQSGLKPELVLVFRNTRPIPAAELGALLTSLADDYRKLTRGRTLVVSRLHEGSLLAYLKDAAEAASSAKDIIELGRMLYDLLKGGRTADRTKLFQGRRGRGVRSAEKMVELALDAHATIEVHVHADGNAMDLKITPSDAARIREAGVQAREQTLRLPSGAPTLMIGQQTDVHGLADSLEQMAARKDGEAAGELQLLKVLGPLLKRRGQGRLLLEAAAELERRGLLELAKQVRSFGSAPPAQEQLPELNI